MNTSTKLSHDAACFQSAHQAVVDEYFRTDAPAWKEIYEKDQVDVYAAIHRRRQKEVHAFVEELRLPQGAKVLEVGCGAGATSVALAQLSYEVTAIDRVRDMVQMTRQRAVHAGIGRGVSAFVGDVHNLAFPDRNFQLVLAIGVLPWLTSLDKPLREMTRVLSHGGYLIATVDNRAGLHRLFDPKTNFWLAPARRLVRRTLRSLVNSNHSPNHTMHSLFEFDSALEQYGLKKLAGITLGFGPFSLFGRELLPHKAGTQLNMHLQKLADHGFPLVRRMGAQYLVTAEKAQ